MGKCNDLTGRVFGKLTVLYRAEDRVRKSGKKDVVWHCRCSCKDQTEVDIYASNLLSKKHPTLSCGCYKIESTKQNHSKQNKYDLENFEYGVGYDSNGREFYFDKEDYDLICNYCWFVHTTKIKRKDGTIKEKVKVIANGKYVDGKRKAVLLHRLIMGLYDAEYRNNQIDHCDRNPLNNCKSNLRICTNQQNSVNKGVRYDNTTGIIGVLFKNGKYIARIGYNYDRIVIGSYDTKYEAVKAYNDKAIELFGEFANLNNLDELCL